MVKFKGPSDPLVQLDNEITKNLFFSTSLSFLLLLHSICPVVYFFSSPLWYYRQSFKTYLELAGVASVPARAGAREAADAVGAGTAVGARRRLALIVLHLAVLASVPWISELMDETILIVLMAIIN